MSFQVATSLMHAFDSFMYISWNITVLNTQSMTTIQWISLMAVLFIELMTTKLLIHSTSCFCHAQFKPQLHASCNSHYTTVTALLHKAPCGSLLRTSWLLLFLYTSTLCFLWMRLKVSQRMSQLFSNFFPQEVSNMTGISFHVRGWLNYRIWYGRSQLAFSALSACRNFLSLAMIRDFGLYPLNRIDCC